MDLPSLVGVVLCVFVIGVVGGSASGSGAQDRRNLCTDDTSRCIEPGKNAICSGRGNCVCGNCQCTSHRGDLPLSYTGKWCECDDSLCPSYMGDVCGGSEHGVCDCGFCKCFGNYTGRDCGCSIHTDQCRGEGGSMCGGHGKCVCNQCQCDKGYEGKQCSICKDCKLCDLNKECVQCIALSTEENKCQNKCKDLKVNVVKDLPKTSETKNKHSEVRCNYDDVSFVVETDNNNQVVIKAAQMKGGDNNGSVNLSSMQLLLTVGLFAIIPLLLS